jgi:hypothetical protein
MMIDLLLRTWHEADPANGHQGPGRVQRRQRDKEEDGETEDVQQLKAGDDG